MKEYIMETADTGMVTKVKQELIRCRNCKHSTKFSEGLYSCMVRIVPDGIKYRKPDWFCADGVKRDE